MAYQEQGTPGQQKRPTSSEQLMACPENDIERELRLARQIIFETARKRQYGAVSMYSDFAGEKPRSYQGIVFEPRGTNLSVYTRFTFDRATKQFNISADGHHFYNTRAYCEAEVLDFPPELMPAALFQLMVSIKETIIAEPSVRRTVSLAKEQLTKEPVVPTYCLITDNNQWLEKAMGVISPQCSSEEIMVLGPDEGVDDRIFALPEDPMVICLACESDIYWKLYQRIAERYPSSAKLAFVPRHEWTTPHARHLISSLAGSLGFNGLFHLTPQDEKEDTDFTHALLNSPNDAIFSWTALLKSNNRI